MNYIEIKLKFSNPDPWKEIFTTILAEEGCDSFMEQEDDTILLAYIPENNFDKNHFQKILSRHPHEVTIEFSFSRIEGQDWNSVWESNYSPVLIHNECHIRAPFHEKKEVEYEIIIEPKMSFGTAHHETTFMMIEYLLEEEVNGKRFLDMGAGTGILAILAHKKGACPVIAIDNDEWAFRNHLENNTHNGTGNIHVILGDASSIPSTPFDIVFANINRNILLRDIPAYSSALNQNGLLFLSGFYKGQDLDMLVEACRKEGLGFISRKEKNNWTAAKFMKK